MKKLFTVRLDKKEQEAIENYGGFTKFVKDNLNRENIIYTKLEEVLAILNEKDIQKSEPAPQIKQNISGLGQMNDKMKDIVQNQGTVIISKPLEEVTLIQCSDEETCPCGVIGKRRKMHKANKIKEQPQLYYCDNCFNELSTRM